METQELREKLTEYIKVADERKLTAIYTLVEDEIEADYNWWEDKAFVAEMEEDVRKIESGEEKAYSMEEVRAFMQKQKDERSVSHV